MNTAEVKDIVRRAGEEGTIPITVIDAILLDADTFARNLKLLLIGLGVIPVIGLDKADADGHAEGADSSRNREGPSDHLKTFGIPWLINSAQSKMTREDEVRYAKRLEFYKSRMVHYLKDKRTHRNVTRYFSQNRNCCKINTKKNTFRPVCKVVGECPRGKAGFIKECCASYQWIRSRFVERNLFLAIQVSRQYSTYAIPIMDLVQEGSTALIRAVEKFEWRRGVRFQTYAVFWIRQAVERWITANKGMVRVPNYLQQKLRRLKRNGDLSPDESTLSIHEVGELFNLPSEVAGHLLETMRKHISIDSGTSKENEHAIKGMLAIQEDASLSEADYKKLQRLVTELFTELNKQERFILQHRFGLDGILPKTLEEIGGMLGVSRERVRQIQLRAIAKLKKPSLAQKLHAFLP